eukprot:TRINITY_DN5331_c0_g2_i2.p1 TRINITY_DN5331_c0_g2~~TRINITY_DN5331_c0_g2_i2.p1  ORF type:complete len:426 (+),score=23.67 TRINITY_DN5331_c0_g2_i2:573-1850(+)
MEFDEDCSEGIRLTDLQEAYNTMKTTPLEQPFLQQLRLRADSALIDEMPKFEITLTQRWIKDLKGDREAREFYQTLCLIDGEQFKIERTYNEFLSLEKDLIRKFNMNDYPVLSTALPLLDKDKITTKILDEPALNRRRICVNHYLTTLLATPAFITDRVLDFLGIRGADVRNRLLAYTKVMRERDSYGYQPKASVDEETPNLARTLQRNSGKFTKIFTTFFMSTHDMVRHQNANLKFYINKGGLRKTPGGSFEFSFLVSSSLNENQSWKITKTLGSIEAFLQNLETVIEVKPKYHEFMPQPQSAIEVRSENFNVLRYEGLILTLTKIVEDKKFYCQELYDFLEYDFAANDHVSSQLPPSIQKLFGYLAMYINCIIFVHTSILMVLHFMVESLYFLQGWRLQVRICLLYTSPSPRDGLLSRMPSSA